ncbi:MAG TPA: ABC transporter ATP-binding protein [Acidimicrobiales bacterium]|nr:ABC transporter ATP-binding protein [Acidimicrobiales bacterium]
MAGSGTAHLRDGDTFLRVEHLVVEFGARASRVQAVSDVSFDLTAGETLGLVGESGCGKSTTGRAVALVQPPNSGSVRFNGAELTTLSSRELRQARTKVQMVFQDPISSLNPRRRVLDAVIEPLALWGIGSKQERRDKARATLDAVGIDPDDAGTRRPIEMSGGQCQRVSIARALMLDPTVLICDEPVSALDVSVQAQILNLLDDLKRERQLTMLFIAHDLAVVKNVSDRVAVMYLGKLCEVAPPDVLYHQPEHPYTEALLRSIPEPHPSTATDGEAPLSGDLPSPINPPSGCRFRTRCPYAQQRCADEEPQMRPIGPDHFVACHFPLGTGPAPHPVGDAWTASPSGADGHGATPAPTTPDAGRAPWSVQAPDTTPATPPPAPRAPAPPPPAPAPPAPAPGERTPLWIDPTR